MCGIVGAVACEPINVASIKVMRDTLAHRGPDYAGVWQSADGQVCFGHRRLAIVDLAPEANQPFVSGDGRFVISFNGEIYNYRSLRHELETLGANFRTSSDTEVLIEAYRAWGVRCLDRLSGMFAFAIWDETTRVLFCARDRAGEKPFYYATLSGTFLFASEPKALLRWPGFPNHLNFNALADFLTFGFVPDPKCIWAAAQKLPPGSYLRVRLPREAPAQVEAPVAYWDLEFDPDTSELDWGSRIREALVVASQEMAVADVPVGTFLSGGVDSSSVTAALSYAGASLSTFTIGFDEIGFDERAWARYVAERYRTRHHEQIVRADNVDAVFEKLVWHYDEPFNDYSYLPTYYLCREARRQVAVALTGDGGDELFGGYGKYRRLAVRQALESLLGSRLGSLVRRVLATVMDAGPTVNERLSAYLVDPTPLLVNMLTIGYSFRWLKLAARGELANALRQYNPRETVNSLLASAPPERVGLVNAMRYLDLKLTLAGGILVKVDRASMAVSLETRAVYLNRGILDLASRIPANLLTKRSQSKAILKSALRPWLPDSLLYRPKMGFALPLQNWIDRDPLGRFRANQQGDEIDEVIDPEVTRRFVDEQRRIGTNFASTVHSHIFLRQWLRTWLEPNRASRSPVVAG